MSKRTLNRRAFLQSCALGILGSRLSSGFLGLSAIASRARANGEDFKALVYIFLDGGNDSFNMIAPQGAGSLRQRYEEGRRNIALAADDLHSLSLLSPPQIYGGESYSEFGMHPACNELANLFNNGELGVVCNAGPLVEPTTRSQVLNNTANLPPRLFSHADQQRQFQSEPQEPFRFGWGGRLAELLSAYNPGTLVSPLISVSGLNTFQVTRDSVINPYVMTSDGAVALEGINSTISDMHQSSLAGVTSSSHLMLQKYQEVFYSAQDAIDIVSSAFGLAESSGVDYDGIFAAAGASDSNAGKHLKTIAKMIAGRAASGNQRPVYYLRLGGFDTHQNVLDDHQALMSELNAALYAFRNALVAQNDFDNTLTYIGSEFGRTFTPNGVNSSAGTDHAWGGHIMMMGGMVNGGHFYGTHPDLKLGEGLDIDDERGRWIPTTSVAQCSALAAYWMGVPESDLSQIFPTLDNFDSPFDDAANLNIIAM
jgi:uncharacterized protein (DUF1501 family)